MSSDLDLAFVDMFDDDPLPYSFSLPNETGGRTKFAYPSFRLARFAAIRKGRPSIYYTDRAGVAHFCHELPYGDD